MFAIGQETYRLTARDEQTLLVEPFFRKVVTNITGGVPGAGGVIQIPRDRSLYLNSFSFQGSPGAANFWTDLIVWANIKASSQFHTLWQFAASQLVPNNAVASVADQRGGFNVRMDLVLPPGIDIVFQANRNPFASAANYEFNLTGYLIPPGMIGREF